MTPDKLIVLGFGGHARSVADVALASGIASLAFVDANAAAGEQYRGFAALAECPPLESTWALFAAAGDNAARERQVASLDPRAPVHTLVSPHAYVAPDATLGRAVFVAHHAHVGAAAHVGEGCIVNTGAVIDHESRIGRYAHVSVNATVAGRCRIGDRVFVGAGAVVVDGVSVADDVIIGAGAAVVADVPTAGTYVGVPARRLQR